MCGYRYRPSELEEDASHDTTRKYIAGTTQHRQLVPLRVKLQQLYIFDPGSRTVSVKCIDGHRIVMRKLDSEMVQAPIVEGRELRARAIGMHFDHASPIAQRHIIGDGARN